MTSSRAEFDRMISVFRRWAADHSHDGSFGEWECDFEQWPEIWAAFDGLLASVDPQEWDGAIIASLLYAIARDNEAETLKETLEAKPLHLLALAKAALSSEEKDARWQLNPVQFGSRSWPVLAAERRMAT